jgi:formylglycine-generating enzyme required for sulfatase activity
MLNPLFSKEGEMRKTVLLSSILAILAIAWTLSCGDEACIDNDGDGYGQNCSAGPDCDDGDDTIYPGAPELCDGIDHQCPGDNGYGLIYDDCTVGAMALIPAGCFEMGDHFNEETSDELPVHNVCISAFAMDLHEVTNAEYKACVDAWVCSAPFDSGSATRSPYYGNPTYDDFPVIYVDWNQATAYCSWAGKRLPTEAEWEYAARGGLSGKRFPWGDTVSCAEANYLSNTDYFYDTEGSFGVCVGDTTEIGVYAANGYGLYDMAGNVWEWVNDWFSDTYYQYCFDNTIVNDPHGPDSDTSRVLRGGSWLSYPHDLRASGRDPYAPANISSRVGFRCVSSGD